MKSFLFILFLLQCVMSLRKTPIPDSKAVSEKEKNPFKDMSNAELEKMIKDYGLKPEDLGILPSGVKNEDKKSNDLNKSKSSKRALKDSNLDEDLNEEDDSIKYVYDSGKQISKEKRKRIKEVLNQNKEILSDFEMNKQEAFYLIDFISKFQIFNKLPVSAMNIISEAEAKPSYRHLKKQYNNITEEMNFLISNTANSIVFMDHQNKLGRKGMLTVLDKNTAEIKNMWAVLNDKVFCLYKSSNYLKIVKLFRMALIKVKDFLYSPCFFIYYDHSKKNKMDFEYTQVFLCTLSFREKEYWLRTLEFYRRQYQPEVIKGNKKSNGSEAKDKSAGD